jgi:glycosyltransferase involved in cell wall biosynthesis
VRVLMIGFNQVGIGTYQRMSHLAAALGGRGHDITVMAISPRNRVRFRELRGRTSTLIETPDLFGGPLRSGWDPWDTLLRMNWLRGRSYDLVHAVESRPVVLFPALLAKRQGAGLVMDWCDWLGRGGAVEERENPLVRTVLRPLETLFEERPRRLADQTITISRLLAERALSLGVQPTRLSVIPNGCETTWTPMTRDEARGLLGFPASWPIIGYCGTAYPRDAGLLAEAMNALARQKPDCRLLLIGRFNRSIDSLVQRPDLVLKSGPLTETDFRRHLACCDIFWLPLTDSQANRARWPGKVNDYMSAGRPTVSTLVGDAPRLLADLGAGLATAPDPAALAMATAELLANPERSAALGITARQAAEGRLSWNSIADEVEAVYHRAAAGRSDETTLIQHHGRGQMTSSQRPS